MLRTILVHRKPSVKVNCCYCTTAITTNNHLKSGRLRASGLTQVLKMDIMGATILHVTLIADIA